VQAGEGAGVRSARLNEIHKRLAAATPGPVRGGARGIAFGERPDGSPVKRFWFDEATPHRPKDCSDPDLALIVAAKADIACLLELVEAQDDHVREAWDHH